MLWLLRLILGKLHEGFQLRVSLYLVYSARRRVLVVNIVAMKSRSSLSTYVFVGDNCHGEVKRKDDFKAKRETRKRNLHVIYTALPELELLPATSSKNQSSSHKQPCSMSKDTFHRNHLSLRCRKNHRLTLKSTLMPEKPSLPKLFSLKLSEYVLSREQTQCTLEMAEADRLTALET